MLRKILLPLLILGILAALPACATATPETYQEVNPVDFPFEMSGSLNDLQVADNGEITSLDADIYSLKLAGIEIALASDKLSLEEDGAYILTEKYGKIRVKFDMTGATTFFLTPSLEKKLSKLVK